MSVSSGWGDVLKLVGISALLGASWQAVPDAMTTVAVIAAGLAAMGWLFRSVLRPAAGAFLRTYKAVGALEDLPEFMRETRERLEQGSENFRQLEQRLSLAERAAVSVAEDAGKAAEHTQALVRELDVHTRGPSGS